MPQLLADAARDPPALGSDPSLPTLFHGYGTRSLRVTWVLEELSVAHRRIPVAFPARARQPDFLKVNSSGSLPFFIDGDTRMSESVAICLYLVARHGPTPLAVSPDESGFADYLQFCFYGEATLTQPLGTILRYAYLEPPERRIPQVVADARAKFRQRLEPVRCAIADTGYAAAGRFTVADVSIGYALRFAAVVGEAEALPADVRAYLERLQSRPAYRRAAHDPRDQQQDGDAA